MKITRLGRGYRISLTDGEFEVLEACVDHGVADLQEGWDKTLSPKGRKALKGRFSEIGAMHIDRDLRK